MIYNGVMLSREEVRLLCSLFGKLITDKPIFAWMHEVGLTNLWDELRQTLKDPMYDHIECYHDEN